MKLRNPRLLFIGLGAGIAIGAGIGVIFHNIPLGAGAGVILGLATGLLAATRSGPSGPA